MFGLDAVPDGLPAEEGLDRTMVSGDVLFAGSIGRTDLPGGDHARLLQSISELLDAYPDDAVVHPGHMGLTTLGQERASNPFLDALAR
jgi:glyoxylase-like metal-dependent hydrolase (beta-lactamase superfamily II)